MDDFLLTGMTYIYLRFNQIIHFKFTKGSEKSSTVVFFP